MYFKLTHCGLMTTYGIRYIYQHWFRQWLVTWTNANLLIIAPLRTKFSEIQIKIEWFSHENAFENVCKMAYMLFMPQWIKPPSGKCHRTSLITYVNITNLKPSSNKLSLEIMLTKSSNDTLCHTRPMKNHTNTCVWRILYLDQTNIEMDKCKLQQYTNVYSK